MFALEPGLTFLNHGSFGSCPRPVLQRQRELRDRIEANPITFLLDEGEQLIDASRAALAELVGADPSGVVFVTNATTGVNTVLASLRFEAGDELLTIDHAYNACANALRATAERYGATVTFARVPFPLADPREVVDAVLAAVTPRTRFALIDHVTSPTGLVLPVAEIVRELEARGIATMIDGAHAPGMVPLDIEGLGASFYTGNCHKWLCAPKGAGFLWVREDRRDDVHPLVTSHGRNNPRTDRSRFHLEFDWTGTFDPTPWMCVGESIRVMGEAFGGWDAIMRDNRALALAGRDVLCDALGIEPPAPDAMIGSLATLPIPPSDEPGTGNPYMPHRLQQRLRDEHGIEVPVITWPAPPARCVRISAQRYNSLADYERLVAALNSKL